MKSLGWLFTVILLIACLTQVASDIYAPSIPIIAADLEAEIDLVQWSLAAYMVSLAISQLFYGPLSEGVGRKLPILIGLAILLLGSVFSSFASSGYMLVVGRLIQGCGAGACAGLWRTIFRDVFKGEDLSKYTSYLVVVIIFAVPAAPILGSYLQKFLGWRYCFVFMAFYAVVSMVIIMSKFKDTSKYHHRERLKMSYVLKTYKVLLSSRVFMGITLCTFLSYGAFFSWFVVGPVLLIKGLNYTPVEYAWITFLTAVTSHALGAWCNGKMVKRCGMGNMVRIGWAIMLASGAGMLFWQYLQGFTLLGVVIPVVLFYFGATLLWPNAFAIAFTPFGKIAGYAGALYGAMQLGGGGVMGGVISYLPDNSPLPLGVVMIAAAALSWVVYETLVAKKEIKVDE